MDGRRRLCRLLGLVAMVLALAGPAVAAEYTVTGPLKGMTRPDLPCCTPFYLLGTPSISGDFVAFTSRNGPGDGIWSYDLKTERLRKLADTGTKVPGGSGRFASFSGGGDGFPTTIAGDTIAFFGFDKNGSVGVYTVPAKGGAVRRIANTNTVAPDGARFTELRYASLNGRSVAFWGRTSKHFTGIYSAAVGGGAIRTVINDDTALDARTPSGVLEDYFDIYGRVAFGRQTPVFGAGGLFDPSTGANAIFRASGGFVDIADNMTPLPGGKRDTHVRINSFSAAVGSSAVAFLADEPNTGYLGLFKVRNRNAAEAFVTNKRTVPNTSVKFGNFLGYGYDASGLAFTATYTRGGVNNQSVYFTAGPGKAIVRVANGTDYYLPQVGDRGVSRGRIVFYETTAYAETFYVATPKK